MGAEVAVVVAGTGAAAAAGFTGATADEVAGEAGGAVIALSGRNLRLHSAAGASNAMPTSLESLAKPNISTSTFHTPSASSWKA